MELGSTFTLTTPDRVGTFRHRSWVVFPDYALPDHSGAVRTRFNEG